MILFSGSACSGRKNQTEPVSYKAIGIDSVSKVTRNSRSLDPKLNKSQEAVKHQPTDPKTDKDIGVEPYPPLEQESSTIVLDNDLSETEQSALDPCPVESFVAADQKAKEAVATSTQEFGSVSQAEEESCVTDDPNEAEANCAICLEILVDNIFVFPCPAQHRFHKQCIDSWVASSSPGQLTTCPYCRAEALRSPRNGKLVPATRLNRVVNYVYAWFRGG